MSQTIVIIAPTQCSISFINRTLDELPDYKYTRIEPSEIQVQKVDTDSQQLNYLRILKPSNEHDILQEYKEWDSLPPKLIQNIDNVGFYIIEFNSVEFCNEILVSIFSGNKELLDCWIDTGYGKVIGAQEILDGIKFDLQRSFQSY